MAGNGFADLAILMEAANTTPPPIGAELDEISNQALKRIAATLAVINTKSQRKIIN